MTHDNDSERTDRRWRRQSWASRVAMSLPVLALLSTVSVASAQAPGGAPLAEVDGEKITAEDVDKALGAQLRRLQDQIYTLRRQRLDALIAERLISREASRRGISPQALVDTEVTGKVGLVTEQEIEAFYQANRARRGSDETTAREQIRAQLQNQKLAAQREAFVRSLRSGASVVVNLTPPPVTRVALSTEGAPVRGPAGATVTIVEFSDFHCPFCRRAQPTLSELLTRYGDRVKLVYRDFPIDQLHPQARLASEAARCAHEQGRFWPYHDLLYANAPKASPDDLKSYARTTGLELASFEQCLSSGKHRTAVQNDIEEGARVGVTGTPTFFINGRQLGGAQPLERFVEVIEEELARGR